MQSMTKLSIQSLDASMQPLSIESIEGHSIGQEPWKNHNSSSRNRRNKKILFISVPIVLFIIISFLFVFLDTKVDESYNNMLDVNSVNAKNGKTILFIVIVILTLTEICCTF